MKPTVHTYSDGLERVHLVIVASLLLFVQLRQQGYEYVDGCKKCGQKAVNERTTCLGITLVSV